MKIDNVLPNKNRSDTSIDYSLRPVFRKILYNLQLLYRFAEDLLVRVRCIGNSTQIADFERRKLGLFNLLNFFQLITGIMVPIIGLLNHQKTGMSAWLLASLPALASLLALTLNWQKHFEAAMIGYFALYPVLTSIVYLSGMNLGIELFFILYGILAVFFIQDKGHMIFSIVLSMMSYFILTVVWRNYQTQLEINGTLFLFNHLLAMAFIFYGLYLIKFESTTYQQSILAKNEELRNQYNEIEKQRSILAENAFLLKDQAEELGNLNTIKNKLFSAIAHDLKTPMYGLKNLFQNFQQYDLPAEDVKSFVPDIVEDLNHTVALMDNLLNWAKCQMHVTSVHPEKINVYGVCDEVAHLVRLQAQTKKVSIKLNISSEIYIYADKEMIRLVVRNLLTNALKFSKENTSITIASDLKQEQCLIEVRDQGIGMSKEILKKIEANEYYTSTGTHNESGTGIGLMLCREFLAKNNSKLLISSEENVGSTFSFSLPLFNELYEEKVDMETAIVKHS